MHKFIANTNDQGQSLFKFLKKQYKTTPLSVIYKWLRKGDVRINDQRIKDKNTLLNLHDHIVVYDTNQPVKRDNFTKLTDYDLSVVFEDDNLLIVNKPFNLQVHAPLTINLDDIVKSYLIDQQQYDPNSENSFVISHVHRLDKLTGGLIIYAKNKQTHRLLTNAIQDKNQLEKYYRCQVDVPITKPFIAKGWMEYNPLVQKAIYSPHFQDGFKAVLTKFNVVSLDVTNHITELEAQILTGRKHQIRATLEYFQAPIINDYRYSGTKINDQKMIFLFANKLVFKKMENELSYLNGKIIEIQPDW